MDEMTKLVNKARQDIFDQQEKLLKGMQESLSGLIPASGPSEFAQILERLDKIEESIAELKILQHSPLEIS